MQWPKGQTLNGLNKWRNENYMIPSVIEIILGKLSATSININVTWSKWCWSLRSGNSTLLLSSGYPQLFVTIYAYEWFTFTSGEPFFSLNFIFRNSFEWNSISDVTRGKMSSFHKNVHYFQLLFATFKTVDLLP